MAGTIHTLTVPATATMDEVVTMFYQVMESPRPDIGFLHIIDHNGEDPTVFVNDETYYLLVEDPEFDVILERIDSALVEDVEEKERRPQRRLEMEVFRVTVQTDWGKKLLSFEFYTPVRYKYWGDEHPHTLYSNAYYRSQDITVLFNPSPSMRRNEGWDDEREVALSPTARHVSCPGHLFENNVPHIFLSYLQNKLDQKWLSEIVPDHILHEVTILFPEQYKSSLSS